MGVGVLVAGILVAACSEVRPGPGPLASDRIRSGSSSTPAVDAPAAAQRDESLPFVAAQPGGAVSIAGASPLVVRVYHVPVLMYHRIAPPTERGASLPGLVIDPHSFDRQLVALRDAGWHTITSAQLAAAVFAGATLPAHTFTITIDDGHIDGYTHAFPILHRLGFVATYFVITGRVGHAGFLTWPDLRVMQAAGMEIANHTVNHIDEYGFTRTQTTRQVLRAQRAIQLHLRVTPVSFAYPYGAAPTNLVAVLRASGIQVAYTERQGARETRASALFWPRLRVWPGMTPAGIVWLVWTAR